MGLNLRIPAFCLGVLLAAGIVIQNWGMFEGFFEIILNKKYIDNFETFIFVSRGIQTQDLLQ